MASKILTMNLLEEKYGVCRLDKTELIPEWSKNSNIFSITRTENELSIVCSQDSIPDDILVKNRDIDNAIESLVNERYEVIA